MTSPLHSLARRGTVVVASLATAALALWVAPAAHADPALGSISGSVSLPTDGPVATTVHAEVYRYDADDDYWWTFDSDQIDEFDGSYELADLSPGTYRVGFRDDAGLFVPEYFDDVAVVSDAQDVVVGDGPVVGVDATLASASHITGTVTGVERLPLDFPYVVAYVADPASEHPWRQVSFSVPDTEGRYDLGGLAAGTYKVYFGDDQGNYLPEYFSNAATIETADDVVVESDSVVSGKDAVLALPSSISGQVTDEVTGDPISDAYVTAYTEEMVDGEPELSPVQGATTDLRRQLRSRWPALRRLHPGLLDR